MNYHAAVTPLPTFSDIVVSDIQPQIEQAIEVCRNKIAEVLAQPGPYTWQNLVLPLEEVDDALGRLWSPISHLNSVKNSPELREAYQACLPLLSEYGTYVGQHQGLYQAYQALRDGAEFAQLSVAQQQVIDHALRDFKLSGIALPQAQQQRYAEIVSRLSDLDSQFSNNVLDATHAFKKHFTDTSRLAGLPDSALAAAAQAAEQEGLTGYLFTLDFPSYLPIMTYADDQALRAEFYHAYCTRASDQGPNAGEFDNSAIMEEQLQLRHELAQLLGFANFAEHSLATKMAKSTEQVLGFLSDLAAKAKPQAQQDLAELHQFVQAEFAVTELAAWDIAYYSEKLKQARYAISDEMLRPYFPEQRVLTGLFTVVERLFGITAQERKDVDTWHPDVRFFDLVDQSGELRGSFYLDLYARAKKRGGAWMDDCVPRRVTSAGVLQRPVAYLTCNFNGPVGDMPALFTHDEVVTLFHEFGHGIHHMLTKVDTSAVSGINGVVWDAVELPSQFLENWCWQEQALAFISGHYQTGEPLPADLLEKLLAAKNFQSAMMMVRQLEFSLFDFRIHAEYQQGAAQQIQQILNQVRAQVAVIKAPVFNRFQHSFSHIFAGGYAAGYYSYKWAEVLSADAFARFEEEGIFNAEVGQAFLRNILEQGGSQDAMSLFVAFRGREPKIEPLLRHSGIAA